MHLFAAAFLQSQVRAAVQIVFAFDYSHAQVGAVKTLRLVPKF
jgi:hypothetical protein